MNKSWHPLDFNHFFLENEDYTYDPILLTGDLNGDGTVNFQDIISVARQWFSSSTYHPLFDQNADGEITAQDILLTVFDLGQTSSLIEQQIVAVFEDSYQYYGEDGLDNAIKHRYLPFTPEFQGHGIHYANLDTITELLSSDQELEPSDFVGLNYSNEGDLLAVFYTVFPENFHSSYEVFFVDALADVLGLEEDGASFGEIEWGEAPNIFFFVSLFNYPDQEEWHQHQSVYFGGLGSLNPDDIIFEQDLDPHQLFDKFLAGMTNDEVDLFIFETLDISDAEAAIVPGFWMMHLWVHDLNPDGIFGIINPLVSPDAPDEHGGHGGDDHII